MIDTKLHYLTLQIITSLFDLVSQFTCFFNNKCILIHGVCELYKVLQQFYTHY